MSDKQLIPRHNGVRASFANNVNVDRPWTINKRAMNLSPEYYNVGSMQGRPISDTTQPLLLNRGRIIKLSERSCHL